MSIRIGRGASLTAGGGQGNRVPPGRVEGFILCGGRSSRFGSDKALAMWGGRRLLVVALDVLRRLGIPVRVVTPDPGRYAAWARCFVVREQPGRGPVEGLRAALATCGAPWALVLSVDMPGIGAHHLQRLWREGAPGAGIEENPPPGKGGEPVAVFEHAGRRYPFPGLYPKSLLPRIESLPPGAAMRDVLAGVPVRTVGPEEGTGSLGAALRNVNFPEDLAGLDREED